MTVLLRYECAPGEPAAAPPHWPEGSKIPLDGELPTLIMLAHPRCPCTRASMEELSRLVAHCPGRVKCHVLFILPEGMEPGWEQQDLWRAARAIPGVTAWTDNGGEECARFGVATSGQVLLYRPSGEIAFAGGVTPSRGHEGESRGRTAIENLLLHPDETQLETSNVFGCEMTDKEGMKCSRSR